MQTRYLSFGMGLLAISIVSRWALGNAIFTAPSSFIPYGIVGPISFSIAVVLAFTLLVPIILIVRENHFNHSFNYILELKLSTSARRLFNIVLFVGTLASLVILSYSAAIVLYVFNIPFPIGCGFFLLAGFSSHFLIRLGYTEKIDTIKVGLLFLTIIMLLVNGYFIKGTESVYQGVRLYHPYIIYMGKSMLPTLIVSFMLAILGHLLSDRKTWDILLFSDKKKLKIGLFTSGIILSTIPLSFTMITLSAIQNRKFDTTITMFTGIFTNYDNEVIRIMLTLIFLFLFLLSLSSQVTTLFKIASDLQAKATYIKEAIAILVIIGVPFTLHLTQITLLELFFVFGTFFAAVAPVILLVFLSKIKIGVPPFIIAGCMAVFGWILMGLGHAPLHILVCFVGTVIVVGDGIWLDGERGAA
ncbi:hypothetical protein QNH10_19610 [Sporosarcina thermotolerans]|uniref:hypothetical protein n=1 Tax=Sporosarcina thermotolerans TaxID=633404 RepID=UPI0024BBF459|nr:hypothetical protein [Sporosarcina thermotolerans]WHT48195.1 hypothetical protein QNH10_19610 [Sporosarcina thermotolerans]